MKLSEHEQQIIDEIQQGVHAQDPEFFASMTGAAQSRRGGSVQGSLMFLSGLVAFMVSAVLASVAPGMGVALSLIAFLAMFWGIAMLCSGDRAFPRHEPESALRQRLARLWDGTKEPPPSGMSP